MFLLHTFYTLYLSPFNFHCGWSKFKNKNKNKIGLKLAPKLRITRLGSKFTGSYKKKRVCMHRRIYGGARGAAAPPPIWVRLA